jgi:MFS family permease
MAGIYNDFTFSFWLMASFWSVISILIAVLTKNLPDAGKHWNVEFAARSNESNITISLREMLLLAIGMFVVSYSSTMIATLQGTLNERLKQTSIAFGVAYGATSFARLGLQIPLGLMIDRFKPKPFILTGLFCMAAATLGIGMTTTTTELILFRILQGIAMTLSMLPILAIAASISGSKNRGRNIGISTSGFGAGISLGPLVTGLLASYYNFWTAFIFSAILCLVALALIAFGVNNYSLSTNN